MNFFLYSNQVKSDPGIYLKGVPLRRTPCFKKNV